MAPPKPPGDVPRSTTVPRVILLSAALSGILASLKLWLTARDFPLMPVGGRFPSLPPPFDRLFLGLLCLSLVAALWRHRPAVMLFLAGTLFLYLGDQNRGQPWFYLYWVMLLLTLLPDASALSACRVVVSALYVWAGIQKCNAGFHDTVVPFMIQPASHWLHGHALAAAKSLLTVTPWVEIFIGLALWIPLLRPSAIVLTIGVHLTALLLLGPLGHQHNLIVWPWNLAMIALVLALFIRKAKLSENLRALSQSYPALAITAAVCLLPCLSYSGRWDSYFSFALYSGNTSKADMFLSPAMIGRLPPALRPYAHPVADAVLEKSPFLRGLSVFDYQTWSQDELGVPPIPEPRAYKIIGRHLARLGGEPSDLQLLMQPRGGSIQILRLNDLR